MSLIKLALLFFILSLIAGLFGFTNISSGSAQIAKVIFFIFVVLLVFSLLGIFLGGAIILG